MVFEISGSQSHRQSLEDYHWHHVTWHYVTCSGWTLAVITTVTRHTASTCTRWHFTFALCCHSNETRAPIANPPNSAQLRVTPYHSAKLYPGPCSSVGMQRRTDRHTDRQTQMWVTIYISQRLWLMRNVVTMSHIWETVISFLMLSIIFINMEPKCKLAHKNISLRNDALAGTTLIYSSGKWRSSTMVLTDTWRLLTTGNLQQNHASILNHLWEK